MFSPVTSELFIKLIITFYGSSLAVVETFTYLRSKFTRDSFLDTEIHQCIQKASVAYKMLEKRLWTNSNITHKTKMNIFLSS